jgi:transposase
MGIKRHKPEEIVTKLRRVEVLVGQGMARIDAIRQISITEQTYYRWRKQYGGMMAAWEQINSGNSSGFRRKTTDCAGRCPI